MTKTACTPLALHSCILPCQVSSAIIAVLGPNLVSRFIEQHIAIPIAVTSFRVTVDCKKRICFRSLKPGTLGHWKTPEPPGTPFKKLALTIKTLNPNPKLILTLATLAFFT